MAFRRIGLVVALLCSPGMALAQGVPVKGIVWTPPGQVEVAKSDLRIMRQAGIEAVRTGLLRNEALYATADSLGLQLYQDLPYAYLPASEFQDTLKHARQIVQEALWWAEQHPSARHFGLARHIDTSDPLACDQLSQMAEWFRQAELEDVAVYYTSPFVLRDQCVDEVDLVLIQTELDDDPVEVVQRWAEVHNQPSRRVGLGQLGTWVMPGVENGFRVPQSPIFQARYLENHLNRLIYETPVNERPGVVFVYRWRDQLLDYPSPAHDLSQPYRHTYGLIGLDGSIRLALGVVGGIYKGDRRVFAFTAGRAPRDRAAWPILFGWLVIGILALGTSRAARFPMMMRRYFGAHGFYREAIREGRELMLQVNGMILFSFMMAVGILGVVILDSIREEAWFVLLVRWLPDNIRITMVALLDKPLATIFLIGSLFAVAVTLWTSILSALTARSRRRLLPGQVFTLVLWPRWPALLLMIAAMVISTLASSQALPLAIALLIATVVIGLAANARTLIDYVAITRIGIVEQVLAVLINPFLAPLLFLGYVMMQHTPKVQFLLHLLFRS